MIEPTTLEEALAVIDAQREYLDALEAVDKQELVDYTAALENDNERMRKAFTEYVGKLGGDGPFGIKASGCEWCGALWPKAEEQTPEETHTASRLHIRQCKANPLKQENERLRAVLIDVCDSVMSIRDGVVGIRKVRALANRSSVPFELEELPR